MKITTTNRFYLTMALALLLLALSQACTQKKPAENTSIKKTQTQNDSTVAVEPLVITDTVIYDSDDPAIYIPADGKTPFVLGTDKDENGGLYAFSLQGKILSDKVFKPLNRPNNVDVEYGFLYQGKPVDIAIVAERYSQMIRILKLPSLEPIDNGGIPAFVGDTLLEGRHLMGIAAYKQADGNISVIVSRKNGQTDGTYLWQYGLVDENGVVKGKLLRKFGKFTGRTEIEAIAIDDELGYVYYSEEGVGIRKYYAHPDSGNKELAFFGQDMFTEDHEGIGILRQEKGRGFIFVSDQAAGKLQVFAREGSADNPHNHKHLGEISYKALETDGIDISANTFNGRFKGGLLVAMSTDKTFHYYSIDDLMKALVKQ